MHQEELRSPQPKPHLRHLKNIVSAAVFLGVANLASAQDPSMPVFEERLDVRIFDVEVVVENQRGERVSGLTKEDFQILVNGEPVPSDYFSEIQEGTVDSPSGLRPEVAEASQEGAVPMNYLIFIDELYAPINLRSEALLRMSREMDLLRPDDRVAVAAFSAPHYKILSNWTGDRQALAKLFADASKKKASLIGDGIYKITNYQKFAKGIRLGKKVRPSNYAKGGLDSGPIKPATELAVRDSLTSDAKSIDAVIDSLYALGDVPGRKALILISAGWIWTLELSPDHSILGENPLWKLAEHANALGFSVYPMKLRQHNLSGFLPNVVVTRSGNFGYLADLADHTGGRLFEMGGTDYLSRIRDDAATFYWLGFSDHQPGTDRRELKVEVRRPGLKVRSRQSFVHFTAREVETRKVAAALRTGLVQDEQPMQVVLGKMRNVGNRYVDVPLTFHIPLRGFTLLAQEEGRVANFELHLAARDNAGRSAPIPVVPIELSLPAEPTERALYEMTVRLRKKPQTLQLALHDTSGDQVLSARLAIEP